MCGHGQGGWPGELRFVLRRWGLLRMVVQGLDAQGAQRLAGLFALVAGLRWQGYSQKGDEVRAHVLAVVAALVGLHQPEHLTQHAPALSRVSRSTRVEALSSG